jgi:uncharacterized repeat protein (TIGR03803 family)
MGDRCKRFLLTFRGTVNVRCIACLLGLILMGLSVAARSQTEIVLYGFGSTPNDGFGPAGGVLVDASSNLFGTTALGSTTLCDLAEVHGCGIVYELVKSSNGYKEKVLYSFGSSSPAGDGASPQAGLIMDALGNLYGTTTYGGSSQCLIDLGVDGCGTVFELVKSSSGYTENVLYTFTGSDGANPYAGLTMDSSGNLYGTTYNGGACALGTVFELVKSSGTYTEDVLHSFGCTSTDGWSPYAGLITDSAGNLYGTAESAGDLAACGGFGCGIVFELVNSNGHYTEKVLYSFTGTDGQMPTGNLISDSTGNLYGTTQGGGEYGYGTVFELASSLGSYTENVLYSFKGAGDDDGQTPVPGLVMDASANLYGTTRLGGTDCAPDGCGIVFELVNSSGTYTEKILHRFGVAGDGEVPAAPLAIDSVGNLYGTTDVGGPSGASGGTVFLVNPTATAPAAILSAFSLTFGNQPINVASAPQSVTVTNSGSANLIFGSGAVKISGGNATDFTVSANTCSGTSITPGATCSILVTFTPSIVGAESAALNFADNASSSPQTVGLLGTGVTAPLVTLSPSGLVFSPQAVGTTSAAQAVSLTNRGGSPLSITSITVSAGFSETNTCGLSVATGGSCTINVVFAPTTVGSLIGTLSVSDNAPNSPQTASLTGSGAGPVASVSPASIVFSSQIIGKTSIAEMTTVANTGDADLTIFSVAISGANTGDFAIVSSGTTCVANGTVTAGSSCGVSVMFTPTAGGTRSAILTITDNSYDQTNNTQNVALSGSGEDFGVAVASGTSSRATVMPGGTASYSVSVSPEGGFNQTVNLSCAGAPSEATCSVSPNSLLLNGSSASTATVTVTTTAASATPFYGWPNGGDHRLRVQPYWPAMRLPVGLMGLLVVIGVAGLRRRWETNPLLRRAMLATILVSQTILASCGGGSSSPPQNPGTPAGSYTLTISGTSGTLSRSTTLTLTVN